EWVDKMNRKPGDWNCSSCEHLNFSRRDSCQRCGGARSGGSRGGGGGDERGADYGSFSRGGYGSDVRPGDWYCSAGGCGAHNFASRSSCFKCGSGKEEPGGRGGAGAGFETSGGRGASRGFGSAFTSGSGRSGWKSGDWICG
ncbi:hypothetical protein KI387_029661, partial [Taxus chinensis]